MTTPPRLRHAAVGDLEPVAAGAIGPDDDVDGARLLLGDVRAVVAPRARLTTCRLERGQLDLVDLTGARLHDVRIADVQAAHVGLDESTWRDVVVDRSRWGAALCGGARLRMVSVRGLRVDMWSLRGADLADVLLEDVTVGELDLSMATLRRVALVGCRVERLALHGATAADVDVARSVVGAVDGVAGLRGVTVSSAQLIDLALPLATHLGIDVADDPGG